MCYQPNRMEPFQTSDHRADQASKWYTNAFLTKITLKILLNFEPILKKNILISLFLCLLAHVETICCYTL